MKVEQIYTGCLAAAAYYIESNGEAAIIDPLRESAPYLERAEQDGAKIKYIFETHFHADFVSGHIDLAKKTGASIVFGPTAAPSYDATIAEDGQVFELGNVKIKVLHTPGHTMESSTFLLIDENGKDHAIFSGDTLFLGDVGRPDLAVKTDLSREDLASHLYDSIRNKLMVLADDVIVYPGHGAGSACGKHMSKETVDTLGNQKKVNYALRPDMSKEEFVKEVTSGLLPPPQYFPKNAVINKTGYTSIDGILEKGSVPLDPETFEAIANHEGALVLDTRSAEDFAAGHVPNSVFIGVDGSFAPWVGALITDLDQPIIIVTDEGREEEVVIRLSRVGYDNCMGFLSGGIDAWTASGRELATMKNITAEAMAAAWKDGGLNVLDVRRPTEYDAERMDGVENFPLDYINANMGDLDRNTAYTLHCRSGYRSMVAASILQARGFDVTNVIGGIKAMAGTDLPVASFCTKGAPVSFTEPVE